MPTRVDNTSSIASIDSANSPAVLAMLEDFEFRIIPFGAGQQQQVMKRNARRTGATIIIDTLMSQGVMIAPRMMTPAEIASPTLQPGPILITLDLYRVCVMGEWWVYCPQAGNVSVFDYFRT